MIEWKTDDDRHCNQNIIVQGVPVKSAGAEDSFGDGCDLTNFFGTLCRIE